jgi:hypothetical protein
MSLRTTETPHPVHGEESRRCRLTRSRAEAAPSPFPGMRDETRPYRVQHDVTADLTQVGITVHELRPEPTLEHMATSLVSPVESLRVHPVEVSHRDGEIRLEGLQQQMIVIAHEAIGVTQHTVAGDGGCQNDQESRAVIIIFENRAPGIPTRSDVIDPAGKLEPERPGHGVHATAPASARSSVPIKTHPRVRKCRNSRPDPGYSFFIAAMRRFISSMLTSSLWVERCQLWPKGSLSVPERSP